MFKKTVTSIKTHLIAGIFVIIPLAVTYVILRSLINILLDFFRPLSTQIFLTPLPPFVESVLALLLALLILYLIGLLSRALVVRRIISFGEAILARIPLVKFFYLTSKQVLEAMALMKKRSLNKVVVVDYPRKGIKCLAFVTGEMPRKKEGEYLVNIFLPSTPNPTTGFFLMLPPEQVWDVNLTLEQATKMLISGGILVPKEFELKPYHSIKGHDSV